MSDSFFEQNNLAELVSQAQLGDSSAYTALYQRFEQMALAYAFSILGDHDIAEDVKQEAFVTAYCDLIMLRQPAAFPGWLKTIIHKHSVNFIRGKHRLEIPVGDLSFLESETPKIVDQIDQEQKIQIVKEGIRNLPKTEQNIIQFYFLENLTQRDISNRLKLPESQVKIHLKLALAKLRGRLTQIVKKDVAEKMIQGDPRVTQEASKHSIDQFRKEVELLLHIPSKQDLQRATDLLCAIGRLFRFMGNLDEALDSFERGLRNTRLKKDLVHRLRFRIERALTRYQSSEYFEAEREFTACRKLIKPSIDQWNMLPNVLNGIGMCAWGRGQISRAKKYFKLGLTASKQYKSPFMEAETRNNLALTLWKEGLLEEALIEFKYSTKKWQVLKNRYAYSISLMNMGIIEEYLGRWTPASKNYRQALKLAEEIHFTQVEATCYCNLGNLALIQGDFKKAYELNTKSLDLALQSKDKRCEAAALENIGLYFIRVHQYENAKDMIGRAGVIAKSIHDEERFFSLELAEIERKICLHNLAELFTQLNENEIVLNAKNLQIEMPRLLRLKLHLAIELNDWKLAVKLFQKALRATRLQKNRPEEKRIKELGKRLNMLDPRK